MQAYMTSAFLDKPPRMLAVPSVSVNTAVADFMMSDFYENHYGH
jgi:hypothetical protein